MKQKKNKDLDSLLKERDKLRDKLDDLNAKIYELKKPGFKFGSTFATDECPTTTHFNK